MDTIIKIKKETKERLSRLGTMNSTFDSVLSELLDHLEKCDKFWSEQS